MRTIWQSLIWKEWHEHKWKLAALTAILTSVVTLLLREKSRDTLGASFWMMNLVAIPLAMFLGVGIAAGERSRRTADFLAAQPVPTWRVAMVKLAAGLLVLCVAIAAATTAMYLWATTWRNSEPGLDVLMETAWQIYPPQFRTGNWFIASALTAMAASGSVYLWTAAAGLHRADEVSAGAKAALLMISWWGVLLLLSMQLYPKWFEGNARKLIAGVVLASPGGALMRFDTQPIFEWAESPWAGRFGFAVHLGIAAWFVYSYGRVSGRWMQWKNRLDAEELIGWLGPPQHSQLAVIAWKQVRESAPVAIVGVGAALVIAAILSLSHWSEWSNAAQPSAVFAEVFGAIIVIFSVFITLVVGIGAGLVDLSPPINNFWRSRPINPDTWFWTKLVVGMLVLVVTLLVPVFALAAIARHAGSTNLWSAFTSLVAWSFVGMNLSIYVSVMAMTCLVRQPIYGAILGIAALGVGPFLMLLGLQGVDNYVWPGSGRLFEPYANELSTGAMVVTVLATLVLGWLAMRNDWGWKR